MVRFLVVVFVFLPVTVRAETRGVLRVGIAPIDLAVADDTPLLAEPVDEAVDAYNGAAAAYDQAHGTDGSAMATPRIGREDLGVEATMLTLAPALEIGGEHVFFRIEAHLGQGDDLRTVGVGLYPLNVAVPLRRGRVVPYVSAGGAASWLDRASVDGEVGALLTARAAAGVRLGDRVTVEVGYGAWVLGGLVDRGELETMVDDYDPRGDAPPPRPDDAIAGGEQRGLVDVSVGLAI